MSRILVVGGYGAFGAHAAARLARTPGMEIIIAGRTPGAAAQHARLLARTAKAKVSHARLDATTVTPKAIAALEPTVVINASGPFQAQDYGLARAAMAARCHYVDLADARAFVAGIRSLDAEAKSADVAVISGASSVPGLSSAVVQAFAKEIARLDAIEIGISPGNSFDPGTATVASILAQAGKAYSSRIAGREVIVHGWQGLSRHRFPGLGARLMSNVAVPDLDLLPAHFLSVQTVRFTAGLEAPMLHLGLWGLSWLVRARVMRSLAPLSSALLRAKRNLRFLGSDRGGMFVSLRGHDRDGAPRTLKWHLIARSGHGPYVPAIPAVILAKRLAAGEGPAPGSRPCFALFTPADFEAEAAGLDIACSHQWR